MPWTYICPKKMIQRPWSYIYVQKTFFSDHRRIYMSFNPGSHTMHVYIYVITKAIFVSTVHLRVFTVVVEVSFPFFLLYGNSNDWVKRPNSLHEDVYIRPWWLRKIYRKYISNTVVVQLIHLLAFRQNVLGIQRVNTLKNTFGIILNPLELTLKMDFFKILFFYTIHPPLPFFNKGRKDTCIHFFAHFSYANRIRR